MSSKKPAEQKRPESAPESHAAEQSGLHGSQGLQPSPPPKDLDELPLNQGQVHPENRQLTGQEFAPKLARLHMDQIDAVATPQGVVLFALTESGEIWQLTTFSGQPEWTHILTPEAPAEDV